MAIYVIATTVGLILLVLVVGLLLPSRVVVERSIVIDRPVEAVFPWAAELRLWPQWTVWNTTEDPTLVYTYPSATTGLAGSMAWTGEKMGNGSLIFSAFMPNTTLRYELRMPSRNTIVHGSIEFESAGGGATRVTWLDEVEMGANPLRRLFGPLLRKFLGRAFARNLAGLKAAALNGEASGPGPK